MHVRGLSMALLTLSSAPRAYAYRAVCGLFDNDGNARNILFTSGDDGHTVAIDQACCSLDPENAISKRLVDRYHQRLQKFLKDLFAPTAGGAAEAAAGSGGSGNSAVGEVAQFLYNETVHDVGDEGRAMLLQGLREGVMAVAALPTDFFNRLKDYMAGMVQTDWQNVWADGLKRIHVLFLENAHARFKACVEDAAHEPTLAATRALADAEGGFVVNVMPGRGGSAPYEGGPRLVKHGVDGEPSGLVPPREPGPNEAANPKWSRFKDGKAPPGYGGSS
mmetsp:Transcript_33252/g.56904  ORF Transcript_33252/g.56904 Transcript_33252/m.56904 type:complete len:277 (-) Transcript_33252:78-908(-)